MRAIVQSRAYQPLAHQPSSEFACGPSISKENGLSTPTLKQHMAAIRMLFDHLVTGGVLEHNPALSVKVPRQKLGKGKTPCCRPRKPASCCAR